MKTNMEDENKNLKNVYKENIMIMKLLIGEERFQNDITKIRKELKIPLKRGLTGWREEKQNEFWEKFIKSGKYGKYWREILEHLLIKYKLRANFIGDLRRYILFNKITAPERNYGTSLDYFGEEKGKSLTKGIGKAVHLIAYARLTKTEIREAMKLLNKIQTTFFPKNPILDLRPKIDIDFALRIEKEMDKRMRKIEEKPNEYLQMVKERCGEEEFKETIKLWKQQGRQPFEREIIRYTSKEIAEKFLGDRKKDSTVRSIYFNLKKKRKQLFY